jgi:thioredoxin reductase
VQRGAKVDTVIVGGGPAGMSAALVLGRCCRDVVLFDRGRYRNAASRSIHGLRSRDALQAIVAAGEGSKAALAINKALMQEDLISRSGEPQAPDALQV